MTRGGRGALELSGCLLLVVLTPGNSSAGWPPSQKFRGAKAPEAPQTKDAVFKSEIRPILVAHCAPCHEPGGKMYAKLPFDDPSVLSSHEPGVKKRLKGDDVKAFERWLAMAPGKS
jgi:cytochrome c553